MPPGHAFAAPTRQHAFQGIERKLKSPVERRGFSLSGGIVALDYLYFLWSRPPRSPDVSSFLSLRSPEVSAFVSPPLLRVVSLFAP